MPIEMDKEPNSTRKYQRKRDGTPVPWTPPKEPPAPTTTRVRMLKRLVGSRHGSYDVGQVANLAPDVAKWWIQLGLAELDKSLDGPQETK